MITLRFQASNELALKRLAEDKRMTFVSAHSISVVVDFEPDTDDVAMLRRNRIAGGGLDRGVGSEPLKIDIVNIKANGDSTHRPALQTTRLVLDEIPTPSRALELYMEFIPAARVSLAQHEKALAEFTAEMERRNEIERGAYLAKKAAQEEEARRRMFEVTHPDYKDGKAILNLKEACFTVSQRQPDRRFTSWVMEVSGYDPIAKRYTGRYINAGTVEIDDSPKVYLIGVENGSVKRHNLFISVVALENGVLVDKDIDDSNELRGWQLRIRDRVLALLSPAPAE